MTQAYTSKKFWDNYFESHKADLAVIDEVPFSEVFKKHLKPDPSRTAMEIGCAASKFLCYISKNFGYKSFGVDYSEAIEETGGLFRYNGLSEPTLYKEDVFNWQTNTKFDLVCSFGFIEHFEDINKVIERHLHLTKPGGQIIITLPHFSHGQYLLHWLIDKENLEKHNTRIMNLKAIRRAFENMPVKIDYLSYYKTFGFWTENRSMNALEKALNWVILKFGKVVTKIFGYDRPNPIFSPHIICIATKTQ